jgi:protein YibB
MEKGNRGTTLIIAAASGYTPDNVRPWVESLKSSGYTSKVCIVMYETLDGSEIALENYFKESGFHIFKTNATGETHIATQRFNDYAEVLESDYGNDVELVIHTDIRDVIFQENPETWLRTNLRARDHILATSEGITYNHEDWNGDGLQTQFGESVFEEFKNVETLCSGIIAGQKKIVTELFKTMYELAFYATNPDGFVDQHFYNLAIRKIYPEYTHISSPSESWNINFGTMVAIPFNDPNWSSGNTSAYSGYSRERSGNYLDNMLSSIPQFIDGKVCNELGVPYTIVHQYDRYSEWGNQINTYKSTEIVEDDVDVTVVTGLYDLKREDWSGFQRPYEHYQEWMKNILTFNSPMVIFVDPSDVEFVKAERERHDLLDKTEIIPLPFSEFETQKRWGTRINEVMKSDKFLNGQTVPEHPQIKHPSYNILMHEKIQFVSKAIANNTFNTDYFMWLDAGVYHVADRKDLLNSKFPRLTKSFVEDKIHLICIEDPTDSDLEIEKFFKGHNVRIIGGSWLGHKDAVVEFIKTYEGLIDLTLSNEMFDQDQSYLTLSYLTNPSICKVHKGNWSDALNLWA